MERQENERWSSDRVLDAWEGIIMQAWDFDAELARCCNQSSYLDRRLLSEFLGEVRIAKEFVLAVLYLASGWTADQVDREIVRRCQASLAQAV